MNTPAQAAPPVEPSAETEEPVVIQKPSRLKKIGGAVKNAGPALGHYIVTRRPKRGFMIFVLVCYFILTGLGTWQLARLHQKNELLASIKQTLSGPLTDITQKWPTTAADWQKLSYQPLVLRGQWLSLHRFKLVPRTYEDEVGYQLLLPLQLPDRQVVLIDRGFVRDGQEILPPRDGQDVTIQGVGFVPPANKPWQTPENIPSRNLWTWLDVPALQHEIGVQSMAPLVVYQARDTESSDYPIGGQLPTPFRNTHAQYAMTWYMLALVLLFIAFIASGAREENTVPQSGEAAPMDPVAARGHYPEATD